MRRPAADTSRVSRFWMVGGLALAASGCHHDDHAVAVIAGGKAVAGGASGSGVQNADPTAGHAAAVGVTTADGGLTVMISASSLVVCPGQCVELMAQASGGTPAYRFNWDHELGDGAGPQHVCPTQTTRYAVSVGDSSVDSEFSRHNPDFTASVSIAVVAAESCGDMEANDAGPVGAAADAARDAGEPVAPSRELCSLRAHVSGGGISIVDAVKNHEMLVDAHGDLVLIGAYTGTIELQTTRLVSTSRTDAFVIKLDHDCHVIWAKSFSAKPTEQADGELWFAAVASDAASNLYLGGGFTGKLELGTLAASSVFGGVAIALDPKGAPIWGKAYTSSAAAVAITDLVVDAQSHLTLIGYGGADTSFGGAPLGLLYAASIPALVQLGSDGSFGWSRSFTSPDLLYGLASGSQDGSLLLTGWGSKSVDLGSGALSLGNGGRFLAKLDARGRQVWLRALPHGDNPQDQWNWWKGGSAVAPNGELVVLRDEPETLPDDSGDRWLNDSIEKYASDGTPLWQQRLSDSSLFELAIGSALAVAADSHVVRFGSFLGTTNFAGQKLVSRGDSDVVLVELSDDNHWLWTHQMGAELADHALGVALDHDGHVFASYVGNQSDESDLIVVKLSR